MKKSTIVAGAVASAFVLAAVPAVVPALGMAAFAAEGGDVTITDSRVNFTADEKAAYFVELEAKYPNMKDWMNIWGIVYPMINQYGCTGKGCAAENLLKDDSIATTLKDNGIDTTNMNSMERLEAVKTIKGYDQDAELKELVQLIEGEVSGIVFGYENDGGYNLVSFLPEDFDTEAMKSMTLAEVVDAVTALPGYEAYDSLIVISNDLRYGQNTPEELQTKYAELDTAIAAVEKFEATQNAISTPTETPKTPEQVEATNELQKFVDETKKDPTYQKYAKLIGYVRYAEYLIDILNGNIDAGGKGGETAEPVALADEATVNVDAELEAEIVATIKNIGDAMRELGIETDLGKNITTANVDDLKAAIGQAKTVEKFTEYEALVDAIATAEAALMSGSTDAAELKKALAAVQAATAKVLPPDTGVAANHALDVDSAIETITSLVVIVALATVAGAAVVAKRCIARKQR